MEAIGGALFTADTMLDTTGFSGSTRSSGGGGGRSSSADGRYFYNIHDIYYYWVKGHLSGRLNNVYSYIKNLCNSARPI